MIGHIIHVCTMWEDNETVIINMQYILQLVDNIKLHTEIHTYILTYKYMQITPV